MHNIGLADLPSTSCHLVLSTLGARVPQMRNGEMLVTAAGIWTGRDMDRGHQADATNTRKCLDTIR